MAKKQQESVIEVEGRQIKLSNLEKVLYPKAGFTKGQVIDYYVRIAPVLLPHLAERPLSAVPDPPAVVRGLAGPDSAAAVPSWS